MLVRPMIGGWEPARIERIASLESRRLAVLPVAGLSGDLHQDLGRGAVAVEITGSLWGDEARDTFLAELRAAHADFEMKLDTAWAMERTAKHGARRRRRRLAVGLATAAVLSLTAFGVGSWAAKSPEGTPCASDAPCRSGLCFGGRCAALCDHDDDCRRGQMCRPAVGLKPVCYPIYE